jgi:hypothetical protein
MPAAFSATMLTGALVLPEVTVGMIEASATYTWSSHLALLHNRDIRDAYPYRR